MNVGSVVGSPTTCMRAGLASDVLANFGKLTIRATGGSMLPAIAPGDLLHFHACMIDDIAPGQVLLVQDGARLVAHRLLHRQDNEMLTQGDALTAPDAPVATHNVLGVLVGQQRGTSTLRHAGGRHWLRRQRAARWLIRRINPIHHLFSRAPLLATLLA
ncbi:S24/S26 family peptidase [Thermomonas sp. HDW16]|uniref:S24/S26 family peptidase n=1 Tax=Thermomonas sp. HDW16 TaxID=2714945 RepID=UPI0019809BF6|nr:S24/S26 family peptidase [Thermomonas sp. HDW16]